MVILGLLAATGFGVRQVRTDPIRYRVAVPPFVDGADYGEAYLMEQLRHSVESTAGPYIGPDPDLRDAVAALNVKGHGPTGQQTSSQVLGSTVSPGQDFTGQAQALVWLCFHSAGWFLATESGPLLERCRLVTVRYDHGTTRLRSRRAPVRRALVARAEQRTHGGTSSTPGRRLRQRSACPLAGRAAEAVRSIEQTG